MHSTALINFVENNAKINFRQYPKSFVILVEIFVLSRYVTSEGTRIGMLFDSTGDIFTCDNKYLKSFETMWSNQTDDPGEYMDMHEVFNFFVKCWKEESRDTENLTVFLNSFCYQLLHKLTCTNSIPHVSRTISDNNYCLVVPRLDAGIQTNVSLYFESNEVDHRCQSCSSDISKKVISLLDVPLTLILYISFQFQNQERNRRRHGVLRDIQNHHILEQHLMLPTLITGILAKFTLKNFSCWIQNHYISYVWNNSGHGWILYNDGNETVFIDNLNEVIGVPVFMFYDFDSFTEGVPLSHSELAITHFDRINFNRAAKLMSARENSNKDTEVITAISNIIVNGLSFKRLKTQTWLNDEIINLYMKLLDNLDSELCQFDSSRKRKRTLFFSTFFMFCLLIRDGQYQYDQVKRWTKSRRIDNNIFEYKQVIIPINLSNTHWILIYVDISEKTVISADSMGSNGRSTVYTRAVMRWVADEHAARQIPFDTTSWTQKSLRANEYPRQDNDFDCGVFVIMAAEYLTKYRALNFDPARMEFFRMHIAMNILKKGITDDT